MIDEHGIDVGEEDLRQAIVGALDRATQHLRTDGCGLDVDLELRVALGDVGDLLAGPHRLADLFFERRGGRV